jgi:16S rRNA processing protein RimM
VNPQDAPSSDWVTVAVLGKPRGIRGELTAYALSSKPERFQELREVHLFGNGRKVEVEAAWFHMSALIFKFRGIDSIDDAEPLVGAEVRVPFAERFSLDAGEFYQSDLVGCVVVDKPSGEELGRVSAFDESGGTGLLVVGASLMIPFVRAICTGIDIAARRIEVELPEGLKDLNRP